MLPYALTLYFTVTVIQSGRRLLFMPCSIFGLFGALHSARHRTLTALVLRSYLYLYLLAGAVVHGDPAMPLRMSEFSHAST